MGWYFSIEYNLLIIVNKNDNNFSNSYSTITF